MGLCLNGVLFFGNLFVVWCSASVSPRLDLGPRTVKTQESQSPMRLDPTGLGDGASKLFMRCFYACLLVVSIRVYMVRAPIVSSPNVRLYVARPIVTMALRHGGGFVPTSLTGLGARLAAFCRRQGKAVKPKTPS